MAPPAMRLTTACDEQQKAHLSAQLHHSCITATGTRTVRLQKFVIGV